MIGQPMAQTQDIVTRHTVKQVDRSMSNAGIVAWTGPTSTITGYRRWCLACSWSWPMAAMHLRLVWDCRPPASASQCGADRLLLVNASVMALTLLGVVGESLGMDWPLKSNTLKKPPGIRYSARAAWSTN